MADWWRPDQKIPLLYAHRSRGFNLLPWTFSCHTWGELKREREGILMTLVRCKVKRDIIDTTRVELLRGRATQSAFRKYYFILCRGWFFLDSCFTCLNGNEPRFYSTIVNIPLFICRVFLEYRPMRKNAEIIKEHWSDWTVCTFIYVYSFCMWFFKKIISISRNRFLEIKWNICEKKFIRDIRV